MTAHITISRKSTSNLLNLPFGLRHSFSELKSGEPLFSIKTFWKCCGDVSYSTHIIKDKQQVVECNYCMYLLIIYIVFPCYTTFSLFFTTIEIKGKPFYYLHLTVSLTFSDSHHHSYTKTVTLCMSGLSNCFL